MDIIPRPRRGGYRGPVSTDTELPTTEDPDDPTKHTRECYGCGSSMRTAKEKCIPRYCTSCYKKRRDNGEGRREPLTDESILYKLALRVTDYRGAIVNALFALEQGKPELAHYILTTVPEYSIKEASLCLP